jgi:integral membrane sensor domain MASE1
MNRTLVLGAKKGKRVALTVGFALAYYLAAKLGLVVAYGSSMASPVWPSSGLALAAVLLLGVEVWPGIFVGAFVANLFAALGDAAVTVPQSLDFAAIVGLGNALEAVLAAWLLGLANGGQSLLDCASNAFRFAGAALAASGVASSIGAVASCLSNVVS